MIYNQKLHLESYRNTAESKSVEVVEWQSRYERANSACEDVLTRLELREQENADLQARVEVITSLSFSFFLSLLT